LLLFLLEAYGAGGNWTANFLILPLLAQFLILMGHDGTTTVVRAETLDVEDYGIEFENYNAFMNEHRMNMHVRFLL
jgi:hypothetical protein